MDGTIITDSPEQTIALGRQLARRLTPPKLILLRGELGAGKTTLVKGVAEAFAAARQDEVTSPTFTLVHEYRGEATIYHVDLYRVETQRELETLGVDDLMADPRAILLIEWGEKFERFRRERDLEITMEHVSPEKRKITITT